MQSKKTKKLIVANSILLTFLVIGFVYSWFASNYGNQVDGDRVEIITDSALEISLNGTDWSSYLDLANSPGHIDMANLKFKDISGSGAGSFIRPALNQMNGYAEVNTDSSSEWSTPTANTDYIKFDLYMRSYDPLDVYLGNGSSVTPVTDYAHLLNISSTDAVLYNKSSYGSFSKDLVAGAVRVSAVKETSHLFTWIPCPNIFLNASPTQAITTYDISIDKTTGSSFTHTYLDSDITTKANTEVNLNAALTATGTLDGLPDTTHLATLNSTKVGDFYQDMVTVYIWLEGCDNEARRAFVGGKFNVKLSLSATDIVSP